MSRILLLALLSLSALALTAPAQAAAEPARLSADGNGCPDAEPPADPALPGAAAATGGTAAAAPEAKPRAQRAPSSGGDAAPVRLRWHSFVPGMFM